MSSLPTKGWHLQLRELCSSPIAIIAVTCLVGYLAYMRTFRQEQPPTYDDEDYKREGHVELPVPLKDLKLTLTELATYDCHHAKKTHLVALHGIVYDVSSAPHDFGPEGKFYMLSGRDIGSYIENAATYDVRDQVTILKEWKIMLEDYFYVAGEIIADEAEESSTSDEDEEEPADEESNELSNDDAETTEEEIPVSESIQSDDNDSLRTAYDCLNDDDKEDEENESETIEEDEEIKSETLELGQDDGVDGADAVQVAGGAVEGNGGAVKGNDGAVKEVGGAVIETSDALQGDDGAVQGDGGAVQGDGGAVEGGGIIGGAANDTISNRSVYNDAGDGTLVWKESDETVVSL